MYFSAAISAHRATTWVHTSAFPGTHSQLGELGHIVTVLCPSILHVTVPVTGCMHVFMLPPSGHLPTDSWVLLSAQGCVLHTRGSDNTDTVCKQGWLLGYDTRSDRWLNPGTFGLLASALDHSATSPPVNVSNKWQLHFWQCMIGYFKHPCSIALHYICVKGSLNYNSNTWLGSQFLNVNDFSADTRHGSHVALTWNLTKPQLKM